MTDMVPLHDYSRSCAVVMGTWNYSYLPPVLPAENSLKRMIRLLSGHLCGWPADRMVTLANLPGPGDIPDRLITAFEAAFDIALFYYVGHGQIDKNNELCLGLTSSSTEPNHRATTSLPFQAVRTALLESPAAIKIVILDCCFAGLANLPANTLTALPTDVIDKIAGTGAYTMAASGPYSTAWYETGPDDSFPQTYFTKYLADLVESGIPGSEPLLRIHPLFMCLRDNLARDGRPVPCERSVDGARDFTFARNAAPAQTHRDAQAEARDLALRLAEAEADRTRQQAEAQAQLQELRSLAAAQNRALERLRERAYLTYLTTAGRQELDKAIRAAEQTLTATAAALEASSGAEFSPSVLEGGFTDVSNWQADQVYDSTAPDGADPLRAYFGLLRPGPRARSPWHALSNKDIRLFFASNVVADTATWLQGTAQITVLYQLTRSVLAVGILVCAQFSSPLLLGMWARGVVERVGARRTLVLSRLMSAAVLGTLAAVQFAQGPDKVTMVAATLASSATFTFSFHARSAITSMLVPPPTSREALTLDAISFNMGRIFSPVFAITLIMSIGSAWPLAISAAAFEISVVALFFIRRHEPVARTRAADGFRMAYSRPEIMILLLMAGAISVGSSSLCLACLGLARQVFGQSITWSALLVTAVGSGAVLAALRRPLREPSLRLAATIMALFGFAIVLFALSPAIWLCIPVAIVAGMALMSAGSTVRILLAKTAGPSRENMTIALWATTCAGGTCFAALFGSWLTEVLGLRFTLTLMAVPALIPIWVTFFIGIRAAAQGR